ncbi:MAG: DNA polymerase III subunit gamma/tau [Sphaerochaetaceae bacterium]
MAYEVTATRRRPQLFDTLVGQEFVVSTIKNSIESGRFAHAYLFSGPRGVGKTSSARILAKALNCEKGPTPYPCGVCPSCREITAGNSTDVIEIDGASNTSVNDIRIIKDEVLFPPQSSRYKIYIIDEVHMLSTSAFNALLKTIEEPPSYVLFIFATTETHKVPATIRSRCQQFNFQLIPLETIKTVLKETVDEMGIEAEDDALFWIAKEATGSMRDAYTLFDQILSFSEGTITLDKILKKLGIAGVDSINTLIQHVCDNQGEQALVLLEQLLDSGISVEQCIKDIASYFRSLLLIKRNIRSESILGMQVHNISDRVIASYNEEQLEAALHYFLQLYKDIRYSISPRFELELAVSRLLNLANMASSATLVKQIRELKGTLTDSSEISVNVSPVKKAVTPPPVKPVRQKLEEKEQEQVIQKNIEPEPVVKREHIDQQTISSLIQKMAQQRDSTGLLLHQVVKVEDGGDSLRLVFSSQYALDSAKEEMKRFQKMFFEHCGFNGSVVFDIDKPEEKEVKEDDTVIQTIANMFRGEILTK